MLLKCKSTTNKKKVFSNCFQIVSSLSEIIEDKCFVTDRVTGAILIEPGSYITITAQLFDSTHTITVNTFTVKESSEKYSY